MAKEKIRYDSTPEGQAEALADASILEGDTSRKLKAALQERPDARVHSRVIGSWEGPSKVGKQQYNRDTVKIVYPPKFADFPAQPLEVPHIEKIPSRPPKRSHKEIFVFSDAQIDYRWIEHEGLLMPLHDEAAIAAALALAKHIKPDVVVDLGDTTDLAGMSRFAPDSNHFRNTLQYAMRRTQLLYKQFTEVTPHAKRRIVIDSNHTERWDKYFLKQAPDLYNMRMSDDQRYSELSYPGMLGMNDERLGWEFKGGYMHAVYRYNGEENNFEQRSDKKNFAREDLAFIHGTKSGKSGTAAWLSNQAENQNRNIVQGHAHKAERQEYSDVRGRRLGAYVCAALCRTDGRVPSYHSAIDEHDKPVKRFERWTNGVMLIRDYGDGNYEFSQVGIDDGVIRFEGKEFDGNKLIDKEKIASIAKQHEVGVE